MSRAYHAVIGIFRKQFFTFDLQNDFHITIADISSVDRKATINNSNHLKVGPLTFNFENNKTLATFYGSRIGPTSWIASEYSDTIIMMDVPATREEILYLVSSLIHLLESK